MALVPYELFGYASAKTDHEDAIAAKIADGWTFHPPVTISTEGSDTKLCATFTKEEMNGTIPQAMRVTKPKKKKKRK